jgi:hypothetical protein
MHIYICIYYGVVLCVCVCVCVSMYVCNFADVGGAQRVIAMGYPSEGTEAVYRNRYEDVFRCVVINMLSVTKTVFFLLFRFANKVHAHMHVSIFLQSNMGLTGAIGFWSSSTPATTRCTTSAASVDTHPAASATALQVPKKISIFWPIFFIYNFNSNNNNNNNKLK